jgi:hypothetical protein
MTWEALTAVGTIVLALIAISMGYIQTKGFKLNLAANLSMKLVDQFDQKEFKLIRSKAARALKDHVAEEEAEDVFDFFETVGLFTRRKALDVEVVHSLFFHWINMYWVAGKPYISRRQSESKCLWKDFGYLYREVLAVEMKDDPSSQDISLSPEDLEHHLNDEVALMPPAGEVSLSDSKQE